MSVVKINSYVNTLNITEEEALTTAQSLVNGYDRVNNIINGENVITKLYYIVPTLGKIFVLVNDADKAELGVDSNIIANTNISEYPFVKLPSKIVNYKELIIKKGSDMTPENIVNVAQYMADKATAESYPYQIPVIKVINYNNNEPSYLTLPSMFNGNVFMVENIPAGIATTITDGDIESGLTIINALNGYSFEATVGPFNLLGIGGTASADVNDEQTVGPFNLLGIGGTASAEVNLVVDTGPYNFDKNIA